MAKLFGGDRPSGPAPVLKPQGICSACGKGAFIAFAMFTRPNGSMGFGIASEVVNYDWTLRAGYTLNGWVERCGDCYVTERYRERGEPIPWEQEPWCQIRSRQDFMDYFGVRRVSDAFTNLGQAA